MDREPQALRLWPGIVAAGLILPMRFVLPIVWPDGVFSACWARSCAGWP